MLWVCFCCAVDIMITSIRHGSPMLKYCLEQIYLAVFVINYGVVSELSKFRKAPNQRSNRRTCSGWPSILLHQCLVEEGVMVNESTEDTKHMVNGGVVFVENETGVAARSIRKFLRSPLAIARREGHAEIVALLEEYQK